MNLVEELKNDVVKLDIMANEELVLLVGHATLAQAVLEQQETVGIVPLWVTLTLMAYCLGKRHGKLEAQYKDALDG